MWIQYFFFNDTATTEIYTLSLHDALPIFSLHQAHKDPRNSAGLTLNLGVIAYEDGDYGPARTYLEASLDRKSTRLNSSHANISYAVFCLKKKKTFPDTSLPPCSGHSLALS